MQITGMIAEKLPGGLRISARYTREESGAIEDVAFEIEGDAADDAAPAPEAFALLGALAAFHTGEKRVRVEAALCPRFRDGVRNALRTLGLWYGKPEPVLEAAGGFAARFPAPGRAALFLSGGVDSVSILAANRRDFASDHPASYRDALFAVGYGVRDGNSAEPPFAELRARQRTSSEAIAAIGGLAFTAVKSRVEALGEDDEFFLRASHSAHLAAVAHLFSRRLTSVSIAASYDASFLGPWGTHPMLDPNYGSSAVEIRHEGFGLTRGERVALAAGWREALPFVTVCVQSPLGDGRRNCGRCEKCLRTMLDLDLAGALSPPAPFPHVIDANRLGAVRIYPEVAHFWEPFPRRLREHGRPKLAAIVERLLRDARSRRRWFEERGWKGALRRLDRRFLGGRLLYLRRRLAGAR